MQCVSKEENSETRENCYKDIRIDHPNSSTYIKEIESIINSHSNQKVQMQMGWLVNSMKYLLKEEIFPIFCNLF